VGAAGGEEVAVGRQPHLVGGAGGVEPVEQLAQFADLAVGAALLAEEGGAGGAGGGRVGHGTLPFAWGLTALRLWPRGIGFPALPSGPSYTPSLPLLHPFFKHNGLLKGQIQLILGVDRITLHGRERRQR
jgi:hypothetical protein